MFSKSPNIRTTLENDRNVCIDIPTPDHTLLYPFYIN